MTNKEVFDIIVNDNELKLFAKKECWVSGSCTYVYPYSFWNVAPFPTIVIQLDVNLKGKSWRSYNFYKKDECRLAKIANRIVTAHLNNLTGYSLDAKDGSCPATLTFYVKEKE